MLRTIHPAGTLVFLPAGWIYVTLSIFLFSTTSEGHVPENVWTLTVIYMFEDTDFPTGGLKPIFWKPKCSIKHRVLFIATSYQLPESVFNCLCIQ